MRWFVAIALLFAVLCVAADAAPAVDKRIVAFDDDFGFGNPLNPNIGLGTSKLKGSSWWKNLLDKTGPIIMS
ncbi:hypothetical protein EB796_014410 [Bugula neritina]|uniref:Uncharacterized protein n=1 Tax=Bugula neritina TaxID=10212 RepID=A0A7J7JPE5_BUGNE|nr:hypothetical protein EB796_014410 [Bugula neritina]